MSYLGDVNLGVTLYDVFTTVNASGLPTTLGNTPTLQYRANATATAFTAGLTLGVDHNGVVGLNHITAIVTSSATGIAEGAQIMIVIAAGTVSGVSVVGYPVMTYSVNHRNAAKVTALVANVSALQSSIAEVEAQIDDIGAVGAGLTALAQATMLDAVRIYVGVSGSGLAAIPNMVQASAVSALAAWVGVSGSGLGAIPNVAQQSLSSAIYSRIGVSGSALTDIPDLDNLVIYVGVSGSGLGAIPNVAQQSLSSAIYSRIGVSGSALTDIPWNSASDSAVADAILKRDMSAVTGEAARSPLNAIRFLRNRWVVSAGTLTVMEEDDTTTAWTATVSATASADAIIGTEPA